MKYAPKHRQAGLIALLLALAIASHARAYETDAHLRDPSAIVKSNGVFWVYGTGRGIPQFSSTDKRHWIARGPALPNAPLWVANGVPNNKTNFAWAPDVRFFGGVWHLYYAYSTFGSNRSGIGVATCNQLGQDAWQDQGVVIRSGAGTNFNAIDPCIFSDADGANWLTFGSYWSGIKLIRINPATGKPYAVGSVVQGIAARPDDRVHAIEASAIAYHGGWYYLFANWDACCRGAKSTYNIRMGRARRVTGPCLDKNGKDMMAGGGTLFLGSVFDDGTGRLCDDEVGPGHFGLLREGEKEFVSFHEEWARDAGGATVLNILPLAWDSDGWPRAVLDAGPYALVSNLATHDAAQFGPAAAGDAATLHTAPGSGASNQKWKLAYQGDGCYAIQDAASGNALTAQGSPSKAGSSVTLAAFDGHDAQLWLVRQNSNGTYTLLPKSGGGQAALDVHDCDLSDGAPIGLWTPNGLACQEWTFHAH